MDFLQEAQVLLPELSAVRQTLHQNPELGNQETQTAALAASYLRTCGIEVQRPFGTAVVGVLRGKQPGKTVALRADLDALPIQEQTRPPARQRARGADGRPARRRQPSEPPARCALRQRPVSL